jgi:hypothetical protein
MGKASRKKFSTKKPGGGLLRGAKKVIFPRIDALPDNVARGPRWSG